MQSLIVVAIKKYFHKYTIIESGETLNTPTNIKKNKKIMKGKKVF